jgi:ABC-type transport system involved in multi-copper enzyme maturation permease subunit
MRILFHVARNTFRESLREPVFYILLMLALALIGLFPSLALYVFREQVKMVMDSAMSTTLALGLVAAVLCAGNTVSGEISRGTASLLLSKPVPKTTFVVAKIVGILAALTLFVASCACATLLALRVAKDQFDLDNMTLALYYGTLLLASLWGAGRNYMSSKNFSESACLAAAVLFPALLLASRMVPMGGETPPFPYNAVPALALLFFAVWIMGAVTVAISTRLDMVPNLFVSGLIFFAGLVSDYFLGAHAGGASVWTALYALIPNWQFFWMADALAGKRAIPWSYVGWCAVYATAYIAVCAVCAVNLFAGREAAGETR